jgi:hypothetical protein
MTIEANLANFQKAMVDDGNMGGIESIKNILSFQNIYIIYIIHLTQTIQSHQFPHCRAAIMAEVCHRL